MTTKHFPAYFQTQREKEINETQTYRHRQRYTNTQKDTDRRTSRERQTDRQLTSKGTVWLISQTHPGT